MPRRKVRKTEQKSDRAISKSITHFSDLASRNGMNPSGQHNIPWKYFTLVCIGLVLAISICFGITLTFGNVFNDRSTFALLAITDPNKFFSEQWANAVAKPLTQPWLRSSFALDFANYGAAFGWYHLVNVFLHLSACIALFALVLRIAWRMQNDGRIAEDPWKVATVSATLYAFHPLVAESVSYISARSMPLASSNYLIALNTFLLGLYGRSAASRVWGYCLTIIFGIMALASNELATSLPLMLLALFFIVKPKAKSAVDWAISHPIVVGIIFIIALGSPFLYFSGFNPGYASDYYGLPSLNSLAYTATQAKAFFTYYLRCFFVPLGLSINPPSAIADGWSDPFALLGGIALVALLIGLIKNSSRPLLQLGIALVLAGYIPHALIVQPQLIADSVFYLSLGGLSILIAVVLSDSLKGSYKEFAVKISPLFILLAALCIARSLDWSSDDRLFGAALRVNEKNTVALTWEADSALGKGEYQKALDKADKVLAGNTKAALAWFVKANSLVGLARYADADEAFAITDKLATAQKLPILSALKLAMAENNLRLGKMAQAERLVYEAVAIDPNNQRALQIMGQIKLACGDYRNAFQYLRQAAQSGMSDSLAPLTECAVRLGAYSQAQLVADTALRVKDSAENQYAAGIASFSIGKYDAALAAFNKVLKSNPGDARSLAFISAIFDKKHEQSLSSSYRKDAIKLDPSVFSRIPLPTAPALDDQGRPISGNAIRVDYPSDTQSVNPTRKTKHKSADITKLVDSAQQVGNKSKHSRRRR